MPNSWFQFKEFRINQNKTAMKVGTDGVLLGAWTNYLNASSILDIGTGTGLIALIAAQRTIASNITAIDIDINSYIQANENIKESKWTDRIIVYNISYTDFYKSHNNKFDLVITNPPFHDESILSPNKLRDTARNSQNLSLTEIFEGCEKILSCKGSLSIILPSKKIPELITLCKTYNYFINRKTEVKPTETKECHRVLLQISKHSNEYIENCLVIEREKRHHYSDDFKNLTNDLYLSFKY